MPYSESDCLPIVASSSHHAGPLVMLAEPDGSCNPKHLEGISLGRAGLFQVAVAFQGFRQESFSTLPGTARDGTGDLLYAKHQLYHQTTALPHNNIGK